MKIFVLSLIFSGLTTLMFAQNNIAVLTPTNKSLSKKTKSINNVDYLNAVSADNVHALKVQKLQKVVANYDVKIDKVYNPKINTTYTVEFKEGKNHITAIYNQEGYLISCQENYNAVRLPTDISIKLAKDYPGWEFYNVKCNINYQQNEASKIAYQVVLKNGNKLKTVNIKA
ncbi:hypothetical protein OE09_1542 [Flavobacteriaceae bacterium MAR_2010_72]|nr:hypothetical protein OE09_1542 [Flavobacteriaceae bacterium MAR_2010_72]TVZ59735.1 hypothetical protein NA63_2271 [Flavobacteriaceae bacterium MAR_2010_105]